MPYLLTRVSPRLAGLLLSAALATAAQATDRHSFIIPPADGYGIDECLAKHGDCGRVVADSWCEANGFAKSTSFGPADDLTAAIATSDVPYSVPQPGSFVVNCAE